MSGERGAGSGEPLANVSDELLASHTGAVDGDAGLPAPRSPLAVSRRRVLQVLGAVPLAGAMGMLQAPTQGQQPRQPHATPNQPAQDTSRPERDRSQPRNRFFTAREMRTVRVLADDIIPRDARSPSATEAGVPAFIDFNLSVEETPADARVAWRGGLRWLDTESRKRFGTPYAAASAAQRHQILDDIAWPAKARPELGHAVAFFNRARDMVAAGFFSSAAGHRDLQYLGNVFNPNWNGCPQPALAKLGVTYALMETRVKPEA